MKYFVTGATGFVGGELVRQLIRKRHKVHAVVRDVGKAAWLKKLGATLFEGDVTDRESMRPAMKGTDGIFHVAGWCKVGSPEKSLGARVNILGTHNVLTLMRDLEIRNGVYTSSLAVNSDTRRKVVDESYRFTGRHLSEYDRTKAAAHEIATDFIAKGLPLVIVMPGVIYGPGDTSSLRASLIDFLKGVRLVLPTRSGYCMAHVEDVARGHILAMTKGRLGESYILGGDPVRIVDVFELASRTSGRRRPRAVPYIIFRMMSPLIKPFDAVLPDVYTSESMRVIGGVTYWGDNGKAKRELGYNPRSLSEGLPETVRHEMKLLGMS